MLWCSLYVFRLLMFPPGRTAIWWRHLSCLFKWTKCVCVHADFEPHSRVVAWSTMLQAKEVTVSRPDEFNFFLPYAILPAALWPWGVKGGWCVRLTVLPSSVSRLSIDKVWEPQRLTPLWAFKACYRDRFNFTLHADFSPCIFIPLNLYHRRISK
jgi:hypothetical protein